MAADRPDDDGPDGARATGEGWLTYRYRLGGGAADASGTIKAPSFASAARRLVAERLAGHLGTAAAYLRLRAAGEEEVLFRVTTPSQDGGAAPQFEVVPADTYRFVRADDATRHDADAGR